MTFSVVPLLCMRGGGSALVCHKEIYLPHATGALRTRKKIFAIRRSLHHFAYAARPLLCFVVVLCSTCCTSYVFLVFFTLQGERLPGTPAHKEWEALFVYMASKLRFLNAKQHTLVWGAAITDEDIQTHIFSYGCISLQCSSPRKGPSKKPKLREQTESLSD